MAGLIASTNTTAVVGLGISGLATARFLARVNHPFVLIDTRPAAPNRAAIEQEFPSVAKHFGPLTAGLFDGIQQIVVSPGIGRNLPELQQAEEAGAEIIGDVELFCRHAQAPIVAITGSNGKTTVTTLVGGMMTAGGLSVLVGGNIGVPVLDLLAEPVPDCYVLELSSFQLETTQHLNARVGVVLNVSRDHMDRYDTFAAYHGAKMRIFFGAQTMVINRDDLLTQGPLSANARSVSFGLGQPDLRDFGLLKTDDGVFLAKGLEPLLPVARLQLRGMHNVSNALAALALVDELGVLNAASLNYLAEFTGVAHRCQWVAEINQVTFINDSKATNVGATLAAVKGLAGGLASAGGIYLILGGQGKGADFSELRAIASHGVTCALVFGEDADQIIAALADALPTIRVTTLEDAVAKAFAQAQAGDMVLLSPACASFDMFSGFEQRGTQFIHAVEAISA